MILLNSLGASCLWLGGLALGAGLYLLGATLSIIGLVAAGVSFCTTYNKAHPDA